MSHRILHSGSSVADILVLWLLATVVIWIGWIGYYGVDDLAYAIAAADWSNFGPHLGLNHWALRHPLVVPISLSFSVFGISSISLVIPSVICYLIIIAISYVFVRANFDRISGVIVALLVITTPGIANAASVGNPELIELLFISLSLWTFCTTSPTHTGKYLFLVGFFAGLAWLTRETAASICLLSGICFVLGYRYKRKKYFFIALGFCSVAITELFIYWMISGDPLYRINIDFAHTQCTPQDATFLARTAASHWLIAPIIVMVNEANHGLLYFLAAVIGIFTIYKYFCRRQQTLAFTIVGFAVLHFILIGYILGLRIPRYFLPILYVGIVMLGVVLARLVVADRYSVISLIIIAVVLVSNILVTGLRGGDRVFAAHQVAEFVKSHPDIVYTDVKTRRAATFFLLNDRDLTLQIRSESPPENSIFFLDTKKHASIRDIQFVSESSSIDTVQSDINEAYRFYPQQSWLDSILNSELFYRLLPNNFVQWSQRHLSPLVLYHVNQNTVMPILASDTEKLLSQPVRCNPWLNFDLSR